MKNTLQLCTILSENVLADKSDLFCNLYVEIFWRDYGTVMKIKPFFLKITLCHKKIDFVGDLRSQYPFWKKFRSPNPVLLYHFGSYVVYNFKIAIEVQKKIIVINWHKFS